MARSHTALCLALLLALLASAASASADAWRGALEAKADAFVMGHSKKLEPHHRLDVLLRVADAPPLSALRALAPTRNTSRGERIGRIVQHLREAADLRQAPLLRLLSHHSIPHRPFWIVNAIHVSANLSTVAWLAKHESVLAVECDESFRALLELPDAVEEVPAAAPPRSTRRPDTALDTSSHIEWNVHFINADDVWHTGVRGEGMVLANADTGVEYSHPALRRQYRGMTREEEGNTWAQQGDEGAFSHDYNWWDPVTHSEHHSTCGSNLRKPCDDHGHGTHTTATAVGSDGAQNSVGVAFEAKWIACRNMDAGVGKPSYYISCLQFFMAPTDLSGHNPKPELAPHVVSNSYGCPPSEGCNPHSLTAAVDAIVSAGIFMSVSAGNDGPRCGTVDSPPAVIDSAFAVAASMKNSYSIASYSSRGPITVDHSNRVKPDITAPGSSVRSAYPRNTYAVLSGTSMAAPAVAGSVLLLWQSDPALEGDIEATNERLYLTARPLASTVCAEAYPPPAGEQRDLAYGGGMIDVLAAVQNRPFA